MDDLLLLCKLSSKQLPLLLVRRIHRHDLTARYHLLEVPVDLTWQRNGSLFATNGLSQSFVRRFKADHAQLTSNSGTLQINIDSLSRHRLHIELGYKSRVTLGIEARLHLSIKSPSSSIDLIWHGCVTWSSVIFED